jgi:hypothetical protein
LVRFNKPIIIFVEKIIPGQASGEGVKRAPSYETPMTKHELDKWRKEFWETRT